MSVGGERCLRPAPIRAEYTVSAEPKQFIYLPEWPDPLLQKADCRFEGKSKVLFCAPIDVPFPPHQCSVKVLGTQCLQVCLTNTDFDKVLARTRASARARVSQSDSLWFSHLPSASTRLVKVRLGSREHMIHWLLASFFESCGFWEMCILDCLGKKKIFAM